MKRGFDHLVLCVSDLERAAKWYGSAGFTTTPRANHPWGTDNCLVQLDGCFLEILTVARPEDIEHGTDATFSFGEFNQHFLARREGFSMLVFETADARADRHEFVDRGLHPYENFYFERMASLPDGSEAKVAFTLAFAADPHMPEAMFFCCQQHAPELFWKPEFQAHENAASTVSEVFMVADDPGSHAPFFEKLSEPECVEMADGTLRMTTPRGTVSVMNPGAARARFGGFDSSVFPDTPYFLGFAVQVGDLERVRDGLGDAVSEAGGRLRVEPKDGFGCLIEFHE